MPTQPNMESSGRFIVRLEVVPENPQGADPAFVDAIGRDAADLLRQDGYSLEPIYTGQRGGFLEDVVVPLLDTIWTNKDVILADSSALVTIFTPIVLIAQHLREAHKKRAEKSRESNSRISLVTEIDGVPFALDAPDLEAALAIMEYTRRFQAQHPETAAKVTSQSKTKLTASVSTAQPRKRR